MMTEQNPYADILTLPHHKAANRPQMSMHDRAAQFSPFAALTGFDGVIAETGRKTDRKIELSESQMILLDQKLALIDDAIRDGDRPMITAVYFVPDARKDGGSNQEYTGKVCEHRELAKAAADGPVSVHLCGWHLPEAELGR